MYNCIECMRLCFEKMASGFANVISLSFENRTKANLKNCNRFFFFRLKTCIGCVLPGQAQRMD